MNKKGNVIAREIEDKGLSDHLLDAMEDYAKAVVLSRAIPDVRDGLKPVHRRILWQTHLSKLSATSKHSKVSKLVGAVMGNFHPHGDSSVEEAVVRMAQPWVLRAPFIDIQGNFGSVSGDSAAAGRYIEARQTVFTEFLTDGLGKNAVTMIDNYDGTAKQPEVLPASLPQLFVNGSDGIAYGVASKVLPHNPRELMELCLLEVEGKLDVDSASEVFFGIDLPTGGVVVGDDFRAGLTESSTKFMVKCRSHIEGNNIVIDEVPYRVGVDSLIDSISKVALDVGDITNIFNETEHFPDVRVVVECKRSLSKERVVQIHALLENKTVLTQNVHANNLVIVDGSPREVSILEYISLFVKFRSDTLKNIWNFERVKAEEDLELRVAEHTVLKNLSLLSYVLDTATSRAHLEELLRSEFSLNVRQAKHLSEIAVYRLLGKDVDLVGKLEERIRELEKIIADRILWCGDGHVEALARDFRDTLKRLSDGVFDRRTGYGGEVKKVSRQVVADNVPSLDRVVQVSLNEPVIYCTPSGRDGLDSVLTLQAKTDRYVGLVTSSGRLIVRRVIDVDGEERVNRNVDDINVDDKFIHAFVFPEKGEDELFLYTLSRGGYVKRLNVADLMPSTTTKRYLSTAYFVSGLKGGTDVLLYADSFKNSEVLGKSFEVKVSNPRRKSVEFVLSDFMGRSDSAKSSGIRALFNSSKYSVLAISHG